MNSRKKKNSWPSKDELEKNRMILIARLGKEIKQYELRYELKSENLEAEFKSGRIKDTAEICNWAIAYDTLRRIKNGK